MRVVSRLLRIMERGMDKSNPANRNGRMVAYNLTRNRMLGYTIRKAPTFLSRLHGLIPADRLAEGEGLWIVPCGSIHSFGMRFDFDALFIDAHGKVVGRYSPFRRNRVSRIFWDAHGVLELPAGILARTGTEVGDEIEFRG